MSTKKNSNSNSIKDQIASKVLALMKTKQVEDISVTNLVEECNISRQAFYYHYHSIMEVLEYIIEEKAKEATDKALQTKDPEERIDLFVDYYYEFNNMFKALTPSDKGFNLYISFANIIKRMLTEHRYELELTKDLTEERMALQIEFYSYGIAGYIIATKMDTVEEREEMKKQLKEEIIKARV